MVLCWFQANIWVLYCANTALLLAGLRNGLNTALVQLKQSLNSSLFLGIDICLGPLLKQERGYFTE